MLFSQYNDSLLVYHFCIMTVHGLYKYALLLTTLFIRLDITSVTNRSKPLTTIRIHETILRIQKI